MRGGKSRDNFKAEMMDKNQKWRSEGYNLSVHSFHASYKITDAPLWRWP